MEISGPLPRVSWSLITVVVSLTVPPFAGCLDASTEERSEGRYVRIDTGRDEYPRNARIPLAFVLVNELDELYNRSVTSFAWRVKPNPDGDVAYAVSSISLGNATGVPPHSSVQFYNLTWTPSTRRGEPWPAGTYELRVSLSPDDSVFGEKIIRLR